MIGKVLSYEKVSYIIRFTVPLYIEDAEAIPLNTWDRPDIGDEVYILQDDELFGGQYCYFKMGDRSKTTHTLKTDQLEITLNEDKSKFNLNYLDKLKMSIDVSKSKVTIDYPESELTLNVGKVHIGDNSNSPAVLFDKYEQRFRDLYTALANHKHGTSMGPTTQPLVPELTKFLSTFPNSLSDDKSNNVDIMK